MSLLEEKKNNFIEIILKDVRPSWKKIWLEILSTEQGLETINFIKLKLQKHIGTDYILPRQDKIFEAFKYFDINETKLVLLGQDPYINIQSINGKNVPQAMGLSFSVPIGIKIPPSLKNIYKELKNSYDDFEIPDHGDLTKWVLNEKILLLNSSLTVKKGVSNSHQKKWEKLTDRLIEYISNNNNHVVFLLLGNNAKNKRKLINSDKHSIICGVHPSPLSASRGFFNSNVFKLVNEKLLENNKTPIDWNI